MENLDRSMDYDDPCIAEIYDLSENHTDDIELIRKLLPLQGRLNILECFSGSGRILVPLVEDGHRVTGIDISREMMARARRKLAALPDRGAQNRATLITGDVMTTDWGSGYDVVILGCNCLYELPSPESQEECIRLARESLHRGGYLYLDSNDHSGHGASRDDVGTEWTGLEGTTADGTQVRLTARILEVDDSGVSHFVRTWRRRQADGVVESRQYRACKYPVSGDEIQLWLERYGFRVLGKYQDCLGTPYSGGETDRVIFWTREGSEAE
jgi:SAM-dependent methyltransferase